MASIRKRGNSYLLVVSMGYDPEGHRRKPKQKPPCGGSFSVFQLPDRGVRPPRRHNICVRQNH